MFMFMKISDSALTSGVRCLSRYSSNSRANCSCSGVNAKSIPVSLARVSINQYLSLSVIPAQAGIHWLQRE